MSDLLRLLLALGAGVLAILLVIIVNWRGRGYRMGDRHRDDLWRR